MVGAPLVEPLVVVEAAFAFVFAVVSVVVREERLRGGERWGAGGEEELVRVGVGGWDGEGEVGVGELCVGVGVPMCGIYAEEGDEEGGEDVLHGSVLQGGLRLQAMGEPFTSCFRTVFYSRDNQISAWPQSQSPVGIETWVSSGVSAQLPRPDSNAAGTTAPAEKLRKALFVFKRGQKDANVRASWLSRP